MSLDVESFLHNYFSIVSSVPTKMGEYRVSPCPSCGNRKRKLYISTEDKVFHCFRCGYKGKIQQLMVDMGATVKDYFIDDGLNYDVVQKTEATPEVIPTKVLPAEYRPIIGNNSIKGIQALNYLRNRGVDDSLIAYYKIGFCFDGNYNNRIILPYYENEELLYFTGRDWTGNQDPKYLNPDWERSSFLFNYDRVNKSGTDFIILMEGPFDILSLPDVSVCLLGKSLSEHQRKLLKRFSKIYVALDSDAKKDAYELCEKLSKQLNNVFILILPEGEDPSSLKGRMLDLLPTAKPYMEQNSAIGNMDHLKLLLKGRR